MLVTMLPPASLPSLDPWGVWSCLNSPNCVGLTRRVSKLEGSEPIAALFNVPDLLKWLKIHLKAASSIDFRNEEDVGHCDRASNAVTVIADKRFNGPQTKTRPVCYPAVDRCLIQGQRASKVVGKAGCVERMHVGAHHLSK